MTEFLTASLAFILAMLALGLVRILRGPGDADRMMAAQLIGTGGIASLLLLGAVTEVPAAVDVALTLALLATFAVTPVSSETTVTEELTYLSESGSVSTKKMPPYVPQGPAFLTW